MHLTDSLGRDFPLALTIYVTGRAKMTHAQTINYVTHATYTLWPPFAPTSVGVA